MLRIRLDNAWTVRVFVLTAFLCVITLVLSIAVINKYHLLTYWADEWVNMRFYFERGLWDSIFYRHYGHPLIVPNAFFRLDYLLFDANGQWRALLTAFSSFLSTSLLAYLSTHFMLPRDDHTVLLRIVFAVAIACFGLSFGIGIKLIWIFGLTDNLSAIGSVLVAFGIAKLIQANFDLKNYGLGLVILGSVLANFSFGSGLALWIATIFILLTATAPWRIILIVFACGVSSVVVSMSLIPSYGSAPSMSELTNLGVPIVSLIKVTLGVLGNYFVLSKNLFAPNYPLNNLNISIVIGCIGVVIFACFTLKGILNKQRDPVSAGLQTIALTGLGSAMLVALSRTPALGTEVALAGRYAPLSLFFWLSLLAMYARSQIVSIPKFSDYFSSARISMFNLVLLLALSVGFMFTNYFGLASIKWSRLASTLGGLSIVVDPTLENSNIKNYFRHNHIVLDLEKHLRSNNKDIFRYKATRFFNKPINSLTGDKITECDGEFFYDNRFTQANSLAFRGWAFNNTSQLPVSEVFAVQKDLIVGIGLGIPHVAGTSKTIINGEPSVVKTQILDYATELADLFNITNGGWIAMINIASDEIDELTFFGRDSSGNVCSITH